MPLFITQGRFTREYIKGGLAKPEDRHAAIARLCEQAGGKLVSLYLETFYSKCERRGCGRLRSGLRRVRSTKMTNTWVVSDSMNQPVWNSASSA
jgi:hypothetical protein